MGEDRIPFALEETTIHELQTQMALGQQSARTLVEQYMARIEAVDPLINAVIELNPEALFLADQLDDERRAGQVRGPLHGIPLLLKDNIDTADQMQTTAGSLALADTHAPQDATLVAHLRRAGAIVLGKTNLSEWANFRSTRSTSGWSGRGGQTCNPYALDRNPSGSSSGSGAAVAANLCMAAIGTETDGSIVSPAAANGIVGLKPTVGLISRTGVIPISHSQDTAGPMTRTVTDAALLLGALVSHDPDERDPATQANQTQADYTSFLDADGLRGARLGVARNHFGEHELVGRLMEETLSQLERLGATLVEVKLVTSKAFEASEWQVLLYEFKAGLNQYLATRPDVAIGSLADLIAFNERERQREMPYFEQEIAQQAQAKGDLTNAEYLEALATCQRLTRAEGIDALLQEHQLEAIIAPTRGPAWLTDWVNGDCPRLGCSGPAAVAGYPHLTVPLGFVHGLPINLSFIGGAYSEPTLLKLGYAFEQATQARRPPRFLPTIAF